jgi:hypothetical protein
MIDRHYGHLARDGRQHAIELLDALNTPHIKAWRWWTLGGRRNRKTVSHPTTAVRS